MGAGPSPLEVVATQPTGDVDHFANEIQPGLLGFHRLLGEIPGIHPACGYLGFGIALGS